MSPFIRPLLMMSLIFFAVNSAGSASLDTPGRSNRSSASTVVSQSDQQQEAEKKAAKEDDLDFLKEAEDEPIAVVPDPLHGWNKAMFHFNDKAYFWVLKPVARGWRTVLPRPIRTGIKNFIYNVTFPVRFVNSLLQGKGKKAEMELTRFFMNSTVGILGFGNPAQKYPELNPSAEDMGQTFAVWGVKDGFYIIWPFIGPSTFRDSLGRVGDFFLDPTFIVNRLDLTIAVWLTETVNQTSFRIGDYEAIKEAALNPYVSIRNAYIQNRKKKIEE